MVTEIAILKIDPAHTAAFEATHRQVIGVLRRQPGYQKDTLVKAHEVPGQYVLMVEWESIAAHQAFIDSPDYPEMSGPYGKFVQDSSFAHYTTLS
ncbi:MAG: antibiotic biosynthesis monooxygenase [Anaerolineales bacterium]|nr:antibiotic biosynthesis monooxygenase [Anaerolineales bacterium]